MSQTKGCVNLQSMSAVAQGLLQGCPICNRNPLSFPTTTQIKASEILSTSARVSDPAHTIFQHFSPPCAKLQSISVGNISLWCCQSTCPWELSTAAAVAQARLMHCGYTCLAQERGLRLTIHTSPTGRSKSLLSSPSYQYCFCLLLSVLSSS